MEQEKGISITKLIFSLLLVAICVFVFYTIYTKVKEKKPNVVNSNNNNASVEKKEFTKLEATKLLVILPLVIHIQLKRVNYYWMT